MRLILCRYISVSILPIKKNRHAQDLKFSTSDIYAAVLSKVKKLHGDFGFASVKTGLICKFLNQFLKLITFF